MLKSFIFLFLISAFSFAEEIGGIHFSLNEDGKWKVVNTSKNESQEVVTYGLVSENPSHWTEIFTAQTIKNLKIEPAKFFDLLFKQLETLAPNSQIHKKILKQSENELLAEWWVDEKSPQDQHEWVKLIQKPDQFIVLRYTTKKLDQVNDIRNKWEGILENAK